MTPSRLPRRGHDPSRSGERDAQRGSVTVVAAGLLVLALGLSLGVADVARVLVAAARGQTAADAAALAAAQELAVSGVRDPVEAATEYAARNDASLVACSCHEDDVHATVDVRLPVGPLLLFPDDRFVTSSARAEVVLPDG